VLRDRLLEIGQERARKILISEILPGYIASRRWFQNKGQKVTGIALATIDALPGVAGDALYVELAVSLGDRTERYALPLAAAWEDQPQHPFEAPLALARVRRGRRVGLLTDAFATPLFDRALLAGLRDRARLKLSDGGELVFRPTAALAAIDLPADAEIEWPSAEQTNSTLIVGRKAVVKLLRRLTAGVHPEAEMSRFLTEHGFEGAPALLGDVVRTTADGQPYTAAIVQGFVPNQGDGWSWTLKQLDWVVDAHATPFGESGAREFELYRSFADALGRRLGQMHAILGQPSDNPDFAPETVDAAIAEAWGLGTRRQLDQAFEILRARPDDATASAILAKGEAILDRATALSAKAEGTLRSRVHGDLHLGQVLVSGADVKIIDFEGEPLKPIAERRAKSSPMRDVAGMIRSFDYAAAAIGRDNRLAGTAGSNERVDALLARFRAVARDGLLAGYAAGAGRAPGAADWTLLDLMMLEKVAYEIVYEATNRPAWIDVPIRGLAEIAERQLAGHPALDQGDAPNG
jgi:maltose alpha-D-glucosyltransferase/alpha-amylase